MKELINNIIAFLQAAVGTSELSAKLILKGYPPEFPDNTPIEKYPVVYVDDGGENVEADTAWRTQNRIFSVTFFMAVLQGNSADSLDAVLDLTNEVKTLIEKEVNRQLDGHRWGINISTIAAAKNNDGIYTFFRGREVTVQFELLEDNYGEF